MLKSLTKNQLYLLIGAIGIIVLLTIISVVYLILLKRVTPPPLPSVEEIPEKLKAGSIGEPQTGESPVLPLSAVVSNTTGTIKEIKKDRLIILGDGSNFSDQKPRELTIKVLESTTIFDGKESYQGHIGLKYLKVNDQISLQAPENIRGKIEFFADYINKI